MQWVLNCIRQSRLSSENINAYIRQLAEQRAERHGALRKMESGKYRTFDTMALCISRLFPQASQVGRAVAVMVPN